MHLHFVQLGVAGGGGYGVDGGICWGGALCGMFDEAMAATFLSYSKDKIMFGNVWACGA